MAGGLIDADLGGGLLKKRIARRGAGKSGGYRVIVAKRGDGPWFFVNGFAKSESANMDRLTLIHCRDLARSLAAMSGRERRLALEKGELKKVNCDAEEEVVAGPADAES
ncbi:type II toxin-antitoxin system RelE/ParE family toxin [Roseateles sp. L2-2]|uniref:type II toxin-antitoxin system RelE/ParE family toxin n=1 Tax=Roseateles TaxID=93681 RepID=UPI003D362B2B